MCCVEYLDTPIGTLRIAASSGMLTSVRRAEAPAADEAPDRLTGRAAEQLRAYFQNERRVFDLPMDARGTAFQRAVWAALADVPYGTLITYAELAQRVGRPKAVRAVGGAVGANPLLILIPCHRVCRTDGGLGGFSAGIDAKRILLKHEGLL